jgi:hypothetical protein
MIFEYTSNLIFGATVTCDYLPGRPAPVCSNPDDPRYSDPGDNPEIDISSVMLDSGIDITDYIGPEFMNLLCDEALEAAEKSDE